MRMVAVLLSLVAVLVLSGCGRDASEKETRTRTIERADEAGQPREPTIGDDPDGTGSTSAVGPAAEITRSPNAQVFDAGQAGTVSLLVKDSKLHVDHVEPSRGWSFSDVPDPSRRIEMTFRFGDVCQRFEATLVGKEIRTTVDEEC